MQLFIISILLVFISTVCALPLPGKTAPSNSNIQTTSHRHIPPKVINQLGLKIFDPSDLTIFWDHRDLHGKGTLGKLIAGKPKEDPSYVMKDLYNGEHAVMKAFFPNMVKDEAVFDEAVRLHKKGRLLAFTDTCNPRSDYPRFLMVMEDDRFITISDSE
ncbi:hypothetical protein F5887DRAFT_965146 [Amanita rubescens]|nr:hypothetical protein F5887DRAFT_965146 [Amanita rubescens]